MQIGMHNASGLANSSMGWNACIFPNRLVQSPVFDSDASSNATRLRPCGLFQRAAAAPATQLPSTGGTCKLLLILTLCALLIESGATNSLL